jgi:hypothetical protein
MTAKVNMEQHALALQLVPGSMPDEEFEAFCDDLNKRGQRHKIITYEGKILDGWHRYRACLRNGQTPELEPYTGDDPSGLVIALNVLRRKLGATQRALAGARLNLHFGLTQDEAAKRIGVSKVHINLVVQALNNKNSRVIKMLENPELTRGQLHEDLVECGIVRTSATPTPATRAPGAAGGLENFFSHANSSASVGDDDDDFLNDPAGEDSGVDLDDVLGAPPSANGKVITYNKPATSEGGMPVTGSKPKHPERNSKDTPAGALAEKFRGLTEADQVSFMQLTWHLQRKLLKTAGLSVDADAPPSTKAVTLAVGGDLAKPSRATTAQAAKAASAAIDAAKGAQAPAKGAKPAKGTAKA